MADLLGWIKEFFSGKQTSEEQDIIKSELGKELPLSQDIYRKDTAVGAMYTAAKEIKRSQKEKEGWELIKKEGELVTLESLKKYGIKLEKRKGHYCPLLDSARAKIHAGILSPSRPKPKRNYLDTTTPKNTKKKEDISTKYIYLFADYFRAVDDVVEQNGLEEILMQEGVLESIAAENAGPAMELMKKIKELDPGSYVEFEKGRTYISDRSLMLATLVYLEIKALEKNTLLEDKEFIFAGILLQYSKAKISEYKEKKIHEVTKSIINELGKKLNDEDEGEYLKNLKKLEKMRTRKNKEIMLGLYARQLFKFRKRAPKK